MRRTPSMMTILVTLAILEMMTLGTAVHAQPQPRPTKNPFEGNQQAISNGGAMFRTRCAGCHGPDARGYLGPDLTGIWASGSTDDRIFDIVRRGVPGTEMTPIRSACSTATSGKSSRTCAR